MPRVTVSLGATSQCLSKPSVEVIPLVDPGDKHTARENEGPPGPPGKSSMGENGGVWAKMFSEVTVGWHLASRF